MVDDLKERLAAARAKQELREAAQERHREKLELEALDLEERLETELEGPRGVAFAIHSTVEGTFAVKLGPAILHKRFRESKMKESDVHDFVTPCIAHPAREQWLEIAARRPGIVVDIANKLADLYAAKTEDHAGKR